MKTLSIFLKRNPLFQWFKLMPTPTHSQSFYTITSSVLKNSNPLVRFNDKTRIRIARETKRFASHAALNSLKQQLELQLDQAQSQKDLIQMIRIADQFKRSNFLPKDSLKSTYGHLITILGHYGLWTQLYAIVNELAELIPIHEIDDVLWSKIIDGFVQCGRSTDVILSTILSLDNDGNNLGRQTMSSLFKSAILESNLGQSIYLLQISTKLDLIPSFDKTLLLELACLLLEHSQVVLAIDLVQNFVLPITETDHPDCMMLLISFLRTAVYQSDPQSTLYCYSYLTNHHFEIIQELINQDSGLMIQLLNLASRHVKPELTLNILSQLVIANRKSTSSSMVEEKKIEIQHLIPSIISLCRAGENKMEIIKILISIDQEFFLLPQEIELIGFNLLVAHLGGLEQFRNLHHSQPNPTHTHLVSKSIQSVKQSEEMCKKLMIDYQKNLSHANGLRRVNNETHSGVLTCLINSLIQANLEINQVDKSIEVFTFYFHHAPPSLDRMKPPIKLHLDPEPPQSFDFLQPDHTTISLLKSALERITDPQIQAHIYTLVHQFEQDQSD